MSSWRDNPDVSAYLDNQVSEAMRGEIEQAANVDGDLSGFLQGWPDIQAAFRELPQFRLTDRFTDEVLEEIASQQNIAAPPGILLGPAVRDAASHKTSSEPTGSDATANRIEGNGRKKRHTTALPESLPRASRWQAPAWIGIAAAVSLVTLILLPPGSTSPHVAMRDNIALSHNVPRESAGVRILGSSIQAQSNASHPYDVENRQSVQAEVRAEPEAKNTPEVGLEFRSADADSPEHQIEMLGRRSSNVRFAQVTSDDENDESADDTQASLDVLSMLDRLQQSLAEFGEPPDGADYITAQPQWQTEVLYCDLFVPEGVSEAEIAAAFESALNSDPQDAQGETWAFFSQRRVRQLATQEDEAVKRDAGEGHGQDGDARAQQIATSGQVEKNDSTLAFADGQLGIEVFFVESTQGRIDAAISGLALASTQPPLIRRLDPATNSPAEEKELTEEISAQLFSQLGQYFYQDGAGNGVVLGTSIDRFAHQAIDGSWFRGALVEGKHGSESTQFARNSSPDKNVERGRTNTEPMPVSQGLAVRLPVRLYQQWPIVEKSDSVIGLSDDQAGLQDQQVGGDTVVSENSSSTADENVNQRRGNVRSRARAGRGKGNHGNADLDKLAGSPGLGGRRRQGQSQREHHQASAGPTNGQVGGLAAVDQLFDHKVLSETPRRAVVILRIRRENASSANGDKPLVAPPSAKDRK
ncbi:MAG: hypothetical protein MPJ50_01190 [Pirellulales bacterium]|nr:hypothetical protein [Pirellulales bacterium]